MGLGYWLDVGVGAVGVAFVGKVDSLDLAKTAVLQSKPFGDQVVAAEVVGNGMVMMVMMNNITANPIIDWSIAMLESMIE